jgi:cellulose synthase/poly-beta-1,6-N-acetylglucosamine synthase-like glycosyltransferase
MLENTIQEAVRSVLNSNAVQEPSAQSGGFQDPKFSNQKPSVLSIIQNRRARSRQRGSALYQRLSALGVAHEDFVSAVERSQLSSASVIQELFCAKIITADDYYRRLAKDLDLAFASSINPSTILTDMSAGSHELGNVYQLFGRGCAGLTLLYISPDFSAEGAIIELLEQDPSQKKRIRICTPSTIVEALEVRKSNASLDWATNDLNQRHPELSAKQVFAPWQAYALGVFCVLLPVCLYQEYTLTTLIIHIVSSVLFCFVILIRLAALRSLKQKTLSTTVDAVTYYPKYSVLIALHKEAAIAGQLVRAMSSLDWPQSRLEVLYVCEADDFQTIEALLAYGLPCHHRIIKVPSGLPRTKPKALNFALKSCNSDFVVIYDAEDRPHPQQLKEAWSKFARADDALACVQAPLVVSNANSSWFARMFAFEYAAHFIGLLPYLTQSGVPLPLGGTSNHFRKSALNTVGAWDPYNVTEDADLGIRLYRFGYTCDVLTLPTLEDGPETIKEWFPQRTRWQKGWMQTFLVQNRNLTKLSNILGKRNTYHFEVLLAGFILSPLLYPISILMACYSIYTLNTVQLSLAAVDLVLLSMGYFCALALGLGCTKSWSRTEKLKVATTLPFYWLLQSAAAWRAIYQLIIKPHHWEKTTHRPVSVNHAFSDHAPLGATALQVLHPAQ